MNCKTCRWWKPLVLTEAPDTFGECKRYPPSRATLMALAHARDQFGGRAATQVEIENEAAETEAGYSIGWGSPITEPGDFCGEYRIREQEPESKVRNRSRPRENNCHRIAKLIAANGPLTRDEVFEKYPGSKGITAAEFEACIVGTGLFMPVGGGIAAPSSDRKWCLTTLGERLAKQEAPVDIRPKHLGRL